MFEIPCIIFAGGRSSRMGEDKSLLPFGDSPTLTQFQLKKLKKLFKNVFISCKNKDKFDFEANFIEDVITDNIFAPTTGFIAIFKKFPQQKFFVLSVDSPFISQEEITTLIEADKNSYDATIAYSEGKIQPMCGIYHPSLEEKFVTMLQEDKHKLGYLLKNSKTHSVHFENEKAFLNLNNPSDYQKALLLINPSSL